MSKKRVLEKLITYPILLISIMLNRLPKIVKETELGPEAKSFGSMFSTTAAFSLVVIDYWLSELGKTAIMNKAQVYK